MAMSDSAEQVVEVNTGLLMTSGVLIGIGALVAMGGVVMGGLALFSAGRQWVNTLERSPGELVGSSWAQLRAAGTGAAREWKNAGVQRPVDR